MNTETITKKLTSQKRIFIFFREGGFYPLELPEATVADNAESNPGTLRVEDAVTREVVWPNAADQRRADGNRESKE